MIAIAIEDVFALPGYRRTIRIEPGEGRVRAMLEDDLHAMAVQLWHARGVVTNVVPVMDRAPWTPCPGAQRVLIDTFTGLPLHQVSARFERQANCTHLHDLAVLAAAHAGDASPTEYRIAVTDLLEESGSWKSGMKARPSTSGVNGKGFWPRRRSSRAFRFSRCATG
ncbi:DUF2889 domain-containing protein [Novosphingobium panipatense]|uniref:DUF2889 domain-containing protein n=1 Tax=Novosphingobium panipatense TaxID=428991 RepID=UPI00360709B7